ncbi:MAG: MFS transporter, partial [Hyphomicrobiaceae bacterium]
MLGGWSTLRHRDFALVCFARFAVTLALHVTNVAIGWYIYDVTGSALALGFLGVAGIVPVLALALVTGFITDRFDRRLILFGSDLALTGTGLALLWLITAGYGIVWPVYLIVMLISAGRAFHQPASQAIVPALVPSQQLPGAIAFSSGIFQSAQIIGPALGGILYAIGAWLPFAIAVALSATASAAALAVRHRSTQEGGRMPVTVSSLLAGFQYTLSKPVVLGAVSLDMFVVMFGGVVLLLPVFAKDVLDVGPEGLGFLRAAPAVGAIGMAMWLAGNRFVHHN